MNVEEYMTKADMALSRSRPYHDTNQASVAAAAAQVAATQAIAAAIDRLAQAVEALASSR